MKNLLCKFLLLSWFAIIGMPAFADVASKEYVDNIITAIDVTETDPVYAADKENGEILMAGMEEYDLAGVIIGGSAGGVQTNRVWGMVNPTTADEAANKGYVDTIVSSINTNITAKADKLTTGTAGQLLVSDANGNYTPANFTILAYDIDDEGTNLEQTVATQEELAVLLGNIAYAAEHANSGVYRIDSEMDGKADKSEISTVRNGAAGTTFSNMWIE